MMLTIPMFTNVTNYGDERTRNLVLSSSLLKTILPESEFIRD